MEMEYNDADKADGKRPIDRKVEKKNIIKKKKSIRNPRVKNKIKYGKMKVRRAGQIPNMRRPTTKGERTGINSRVVSSTFL